MNIDDFLEKYLPDYQAKSDKHYEGTGEESESDKWLLCEFYDKYFQEALQNFGNKLCDKQQLICAEQYMKHEPPVLYNPVIHIEIAGCKQPEIEDL
jgi:hypothetical protein